MKKLVTAFIVLLALCSAGAFAQSGVKVISYTATADTMSTNSTTLDFRGLIDDAYVIYPGAGAPLTLTLYNSTIAANVYSGSNTAESITADNKGEITAIDTWVAPGTIAKVYTDISAAPTNTAVKVILFYREASQ